MTRYLEYVIPAEDAATDPVVALGEAASQGLVVRVETGADETRIYVADQRPAGEKPVPLRGAKVSEVSAARAKKMGQAGPFEGKRAR